VEFSQAKYHYNLSLMWRIDPGYLAKTNKNQLIKNGSKFFITIDYSGYKLTSSKTNKITVQKFPK